MQSINQMHLNLAVNFTCERFRVFTGFLCQQAMVSQKNKFLAPDLSFNAIT